MLNYHELTINEPRDSPARRKQFLVICTIMAAVLVHSLITSGALQPVAISEGAFPGGEFVYKPFVRDYAASDGLLRVVAADLGFKRDEKGWGDLLYSVFIDADSDVPVGDRRFFGGALLDHGGDGKAAAAEMRIALLEKNEAAGLGKGDGDFEQSVARIPYEVGTLPSVRAALAQFPFTNGFVSALIHRFKVFPAMVEYAKERSEEGTPIVLSTTCSIEQQMCTHYVPLADQKKFFLGRLDSDTYLMQLKAFEDSRTDSMALAWKGLKKILGRQKKSATKVSEPEL